MEVLGSGAEENLHAPRMEMVLRAKGCVKRIHRQISLRALCSSLTLSSESGEEEERSAGDRVSEH